MEMTSTHFVTEQNDPTAPRFSEREMAILDSLLETERRLIIAREALTQIAVNPGKIDGPVLAAGNIAREALTLTAPKQ